MMDSCYGTETTSFSRRKLVLTHRDQPSDSSKAVILYRPPGIYRSFGRNLTADSLDRSKSSQKINQGPNITCKPELKTCTPTVQTKKCNVSYSNMLCATILIAIAVITFMSSTKLFKGTCDKFSSLDLKLLHNNLTNHLYGQEIAVNTIIDGLEEFQVTVEPLAIFILMGGSGTGKTWTTQLMGKSLTESTNKINFHLEPWSSIQDIERAFTRLKCCLWNFLFIEDTDYAGNHQIEVLLNLLGKVNGNSSCSRQKVVAVFTSSHGHKDFAKLLMEKLDQRDARSTLDSVKIEAIIKHLNSPLIDALNRRRLPFTPVPYLPLEKSHVEQCIVSNLRSRGKSEEIIGDVMKSITFFPTNRKYFASSGCKSVSTQVNLHA